MLRKLKWRFGRFMYGRYGVDQLYMVSGIAFIVLQLLNIFIQNNVLAILLLILFAWIIYRVFSKNISARRAENQKFLKLVFTVYSKFKMFKRRVRDSKTHRYRKCNECEATLRLPRKKGTHKARCPRCNHLMEVKIRI